ncbi:MAG: fibronectin type III domain-containing protein, partial [Patescibacteria group bacterium]|nr:fibronectin type III domain-containing protein [Patescibacteria group bacterium]
DDFTLAKDTEYSLYTTSAYSNSQVTTWDSFSTTSTTSGDSSLSYQLCTDDGSSCESGNSWKYWDGDSWETASNTTTHTNTATELDQTAMQTLSVASQKISVKAIMSFGGTDTPDLDNLSIGLTTDTTHPPTNASSLSMSKQASGDNVSSNGWTNNNSPYFSWTAGADDDEGTGIKGYCLYLGTDAEGDPATSKGPLLGTSPVSTDGSNCGFIINATSIDLATSSYRGGTWLSSSDDSYYLNIKAIDEAENVFLESSEQFQFRYDDTSPSNPSGLSAPSEYKQSVDSFTVAWATSGGTAGSDSNSGIKGYQYKLNDGTWYGSSHSGNENCDDVVTTGSYTLNETDDSLNKGENTFYLRTIDNACNVASSSVTGILKYNADAPSSPQNLTVDPSSPNEINSFAFSWSAPATYSGPESSLRYCYTINTVPSLVACTSTSQTSLSADSYATQPGTNTFYLTAKSEGGSFNYDNYTSVNFTANTSEPGLAREMGISDVSIKSTSNWKLALSWETPGDVGAGIDAYKIYRSTSSTSCSSDFSGFSQVGTTSGTSYVDSGLSQDDYYYCVKACDSANKCSANSETVTDYPTGKYETATSLTSGPTVSNLTTKRAKISWSTGRNSDSKVAYGASEGDYFDEEPSVSTQTTDHVINLTNLNPGTTYYYKTKWTDEDGNTGTSEEKSFTTNPPPEVKDVQVKSVNLSSALIEFTTKDAEKVELYYGETTSFGGLKTISTSTAESAYTTQLSGLDDGTKYYFKLNVFDAEDDEYEGTILDFETPPSPKISNVQLQQVRNTAQSTILTTWNSNTPISSIVTFWPQNSPDQARDEVEVALKEGSHRMIVRGLLPNTLYNLVVKGRDKLGNEAVSDQHQFTTATDTRPPQISNLTVEGKNIPPTKSAGQKTYAQLIVAWQTDEPATSQVEFGEGTGEAYNQSSQRDENLTLDHLVVISNLTPSKVYHLRVISHDKIGNEARSIDTVTIAPKATDNALNLVITNLQETFGFLRRLK